MISGPILTLLVAQILFSIGDLLARFKMRKYGFTHANLFSAWFAIYLITHLIAIFLQLYVFTTVELGRTITLFAVSGIVLANLTGLLFLSEVLSVYSYLGVALAIVAFLLLALNQ